MPKMAQVDSMAQYEHKQQTEYLKCTVETLHGTVEAKPIRHSAQRCKMFNFRPVGGF